MSAHATRDGGTLPHPVLRKPILATMLSVLFLVPVASAQEVGGAYGRLEGDLVLSAEGFGAWSGSPEASIGALGVAVRARYLEMTGIALGYDRVVASTRRDALWLAVDFRPTWLARFTNDLERGPRWLDLMIDSIGIELGSAWIRPGEGMGRGGGFGFVLGGGVELPVVWSRGDAVMVRVGTRWVSARGWDAQGTGASEGWVELGLGVVVRTLVRSSLVGRPD